MATARRTTSQRARDRAARLAAPGYPLADGQRLIPLFGVEIAGANPAYVRQPDTAPTPRDYAWVDLATRRRARRREGER